MSIEAVDHVNIVTSRLDQTRAFFVDVLGLAEGPRPPFEVDGCWLYAGDRAIVHLQSATGPVSASSFSALNHFAFRTAGFDDMLARLRSRGVAYDVRTIPGTYVRQLFLLDPNGVRVELNEAT